MNQKRTKNEWMQLVQEQMGSGLSIREYCEIQELNMNTFKYNKKLYYRKSTGSEPKSTYASGKNVGIVKIPSSNSKTASCTIEIGKIKIHLDNASGIELKTVLSLIQDLGYAQLS